jgi:mannan endo-1,4-beta-mannosidase
MLKRLRFAALVSLVIGGIGVVTPAVGRATAGRDSHAEFVKRVGADLRLGGGKFRFAGSNQYYLIYKSPFMVDEVLNAADAQGFRVMRIWGSLDTGDPDDSSTWVGGGPKEGVYLQYWDPAAGRPAYNDGPNGLQRLDYAIAKAGELGLKLVIPFVNNWNDFGGMDQYVRWRDISTPPGETWYHDSFYTDPVIKGWYKNWIAHVLNRQNTITGLRYKDDPTIMTWELGNEPRCLSAGAYPRSPDCTTETLTRWADELTTYIKSIDENHLVSVGDEGFYCKSGAEYWTENCGEGVDSEALTRLANVDVMSFHLYPDHWGTTVEWGQDWIASHFATARRLRKPAMLGEFGLRDKSVRNPSYKRWLDTTFWSGGAGALYWILSGKQDDGTLYPDYDGFTVYCPSPVCTTISNFGKQMRTGLPLPFPPVADDDTAVTEFETPVALPATANDIAYWSAIMPRTLDLDPSTAGRQATITVAGGTFSAADDGTVTFTPAAGFSGKATAAYVVRDFFFRRSNEATLTVTVKPAPTPVVQLFSFETGVDGWAPSGGNGTLTQSSAWSTSGTSSLQIDVSSEGWFSGPLPAAVDLTGKTAVRLDLQTLGSQTYRKLSIQVGDAWLWCEDTTGGGNTPPGTVDTVPIDLTILGCSGPDLTKLQQVNLYLQPGTFRIDNVRAE